MEFNSIQDFKANYSHIFHQSVLPRLAPFERDRKKARLKSKIANSVGIIGAILVALILFVPGIGEKLSANTFVFIGIFFACILGFVISGLVAKNFETKLKEHIMPHLMKAFGDFTWTNDGVIDYYTVKQTTLFPRFERKSDDDNFYGTYKGLGVNINETELTYTTRDSKGRTTTHTEFKGVIVEIDVKKQFMGHTIIRKRGLLNSKTYQEIKLEDPEFSKEYFVDANDQIESRYLLTTSFMERFKNLKRAFGGKSIQASFQNNKLILAISISKDLFKLADLSKPVSDTKQFTILLNEFTAILEIIDELKLNQNIGL